MSKARCWFCDRVDDLPGVAYMPEVLKASGRLDILSADGVRAHEFGRSRVPVACERCGSSLDDLDGAVAPILAQFCFVEPVGILADPDATDVLSQWLLKTLLARTAMGGHVAYTPQAHALAGGVSPRLGWHVWTMSVDGPAPDEDYLWTGGVIKSEHSQGFGGGNASAGSDALPEAPEVSAIFHRWRLGQVVFYCLLEMGEAQAGTPLRVMLSSAAADGALGSLRPRSAHQSPKVSSEIAHAVSHLIQQNLP